MQRRKSISYRSIFRLPSSRGVVATRIQPSGQDWAQVLQPVQRSSNQRRFVRARGGMLRVSSGYCTVDGGRNRLRMVINMPLAMPIPYTFSCSSSPLLCLLQPSRFYYPPLFTFNDRDGLMVERGTGAADGPASAAPVFNLGSHGLPHELHK